MSRRPILLLALAAAGCGATVPPRPYLELPLAPDGGPRARPHVARAAGCGAELLAVGVVHSRDPADPSHAEIARLYDAFGPTLVLHENIAPARAEATREAAIARGGELGLLRFLADRDPAELRSADLPEAEEFRRLLGRYPAATLLVFLTGQRLLTGMASEAEAAAAYPDFYAEYLEPNGITGNPSWRSWDGFKEAYRRVLGEAYSAGRFDPDRFSPIRNLGPMNELSRYAHKIRDERIVASLERALGQHRRVMLVFGAWHVLAVEPLLPGLAARACRHRRK